MKFIQTYIFAAMCAAFVACTPSVPGDAEATGHKAAVTPDYDGVAIPCNIAPLNFDIDEQADGYITRVHGAAGADVVVDGSTVDIPVDKWHALLGSNVGDSLHFDVYLCHGGKWELTARRSVFVAPDTIDRYLVYRLIEPSYVTFENLSINQRDLTNFDTRVVYDNMAIAKGVNGQCVNCHSFQDYNRTGRMQMHFRVADGGTLIMDGDDIRKINLKSGSAISSGVYPSWHPTEKLIAYSMNDTGQDFHTNNNEKVEVLDNASDLVLYDPVADRTVYVANDSTEFETFPYWNPAGDRLYYCSAHYEYTTDDIDLEVAKNYRKIKYNIYSRPFDVATRTFGEVDTVINAAALDKSATFPRVSPDGRWLVFTMGDYGNFHIWHKSADLYVKELASGEVRALDTLNSPDVESYHSWSSNGRWLVFSSRRDDGSYTRPYIAWFDAQGREHKPFILPQRGEHYYGQLYKSFNIPEFIVAPVRQDSRKMVEALRKPAFTVPLDE